MTTTTTRASKLPSTPEPRHERRAAALAVLILLGWGSDAAAQRAERAIEVEPGQTLSHIAQRYHTTVEALAAYNDIRDPAHVQAGRRLRIPPEGAAAAPARESDDSGERRFVWRTSGEVTPEGVLHVVQAGQTLTDLSRSYRLTVAQICEANRISPSAPIVIGARVLIPGATGLRPVRSVIRGGTSLRRGRRQPVAFLRASNEEAATIQLYEKNGRVSTQGRRRLQKLLRYLANNAEHPMHPRLPQLLQKVADRWPGRRIVVVSGYRPHTRNQYTLHSRHNIGMAVDFRVEGVPNTQLRDFCRAFARAGVGYYPNSTFIHLDVRGDPGYWVDYSRPGAPPVYRTEEPEEPAIVGLSEIYAATVGNGTTPARAPAPGTVQPAGASAPLAPAAEPEDDGDSEADAAQGG